MAVEDPGTLTVTCDKCDATCEMDTTEYSGTPASWGVDESTIEDNGWFITNEGILCSECGGKED